MRLENIKLKVVGVTFKNDNGTSRQNIISSMSTDAPVTLKREPFNPHDKNAIAVFYVDQQVGYIGREYAKVLAGMMDHGKKFRAKVGTVDNYEGTHYLHIIVDEQEGK